MNNNKTLFYYITAANTQNTRYALYLGFVRMCGCVSACTNHG